MKLCSVLVCVDRFDTSGLLRSEQIAVHHPRKFSVLGCFGAELYSGFTVILRANLKILMKKCLFVFLAVFSANALAQNEYTGDVQIERIIHWTGKPDVYVVTDQTEPTNPDNCSKASQYHLVADAPEIARSMLLSAYMAGGVVNINIDGCTPEDRPKILGIVLK